MSRACGIKLNPHLLLCEWSPLTSWAHNASALLAQVSVMLLHFADMARDQDITKLIPSHHRFGGAHPQTQISCRANQMSPSPLQTQVTMLTSESPPVPGSLANEGIVCWEGKEVFPPILFLIFPAPSQV